MRSNSKAKYRRQILIYSLVIILPGIFLSILAYRGIYENIAMADRIIEKRLERKSKYFFGSIEDSINVYLNAFLFEDIIWSNNTLSLKPESKAHQYLNDDIILLAAGKQSSGNIKFFDHISLSNIDEKLFLQGMPGGLGYHLKKNISIEFNRTDRYQPPYVNFFEDSLSAILITRLNQDFNLAFLLDTKELVRRNITVLEETQGFPNIIAWRLLDEYGRALWASPEFKGKNHINFNSVKYGSWTLQLEEVHKNALAVIWEAEQQYLVAGFIFVIAIMGLGLLLTIRSLTRDYKLSQMKSDFVSTVSHEFKSPLTSIRMMSERLASKKVGSEARKQDYFNSMLAQSERLSHLVDNILDFSRMDKGRKTYHFEHCNVVRLAREVIDYLLIRHKEHGFQIDINYTEDPLIAMVDCQGIHQVFYNLIENAIKYSGESNKIDISLSRKLEIIKVTVKDYGIGISKKDQKKVFGQFYRAEKVSKEVVKGSGIGLSIVSEIIKAHHGMIELESELGKGSAFTFQIPVNQK